MSAFMDATCPKCKKKIGWFGDVTDRPACPKCGHAYSRHQLEQDQRQMDKIKEEMFGKKEDADG